MPDPKNDDQAPKPEQSALRLLAHVRQGASPRKFEITVIREGEAIYSMGGLPLVWTREAIDSGVRVFQGAKVSAFKFGEEFNHLAEPDDRRKTLGVGNLIGTLDTLRVVQSDDGRAELVADLTLLDGVDPVIPAVLKDGLAGFSVDAYAEFQRGTHEGKPVMQGLRFLEHPNGLSLDMVSHPAAGGRVRKVAASIRGQSPNKENTMSAPTAEEIAAKAKADADAAVKAAADEAARIKQAAQDDLAAAKKAREEIEAAAKAGRVERTESRVKQAAEKAGLSDKGAALVLDAFKGAETYDEKAVGDRIKQVAELVGENRGSPTLASRIQLGLEPADKVEMGMEAMFTRSNEPAWALGKVDGKTIHERIKQAGLDRPTSFLRFFENVTGEEFAKGFGDRAARKRIKQAVNVSQFGDAFENVLNRKAVRYFEANPIFQDWRRIATITSVANFVKQERFVIGGYANLSTVTEGENYPALTTPGDEGEGYTPAKYGGVESLTREALLRDDVSAIAQIPERMGNGALRTLYEFVFDLVKPSATYTMDYDGETLCDTDHDVNQNKGTTALSATELIAAIKVMQKFRDISVDKRLGVEPGVVLVPIDLGNTLHDILKPLPDYPGGATTDNSFIRQVGLQGIVVRHWTDATDWALLANPSLHPWLEIGFINGQESPQFFFQNDEGLGAMFDADKQLIKVRHEYGGKVLRHEFIYGEVVGG